MLEADTGSYVKVKQAILKTKTQLMHNDQGSTPKTQYLYGPRSIKVSADQETVNSNKRMVFSKLVKN